MNDSIYVDGIGTVPINGPVDCNDYNTYVFDLSHYEGLVAWVEYAPGNVASGSTFVDSKIKTTADARRALEAVAKHRWIVQEEDQTIGCWREDLALAQNYLELERIANN